MRRRRGLGGRHEERSAQGDVSRLGAAGAMSQGGSKVRLSMVRMRTYLGSPTRGIAFGIPLLVAASVVLAGCGDRVRQPTSEELARFRAADETRPTVDMNRVLQAKIVTGPYRVVPGDVLRLEMPRFPEQEPAPVGVDNHQVHTCRVRDDGTVVLPMIGPLVVRDKTLAEIESVIAAQYYPKYVASPLPVYVSVLEYRTQRVSIVGAVTQPGIHALRHDQMSLVALLMQAGGILSQGAAVIRINRLEAPEGAPKPEPVRDRPADPRRRERDIIPANAGLRPPAVQAVFEREGPLRTTGWLRVEQENGDVSVRKWLDIANRPQRREFLRVLALPSKWPGTEDLDLKLARLGAYLDQLPGDKGGRPEDRVLGDLPSELVAGWQILEPGCFATAFGDSAGEPSLLSQTVAAKMPVDVTSAVGSARGSAPRAPQRNPARRPSRSETAPPPEPSGWGPPTRAPGGEDSPPPGRGVERERDPNRDALRLGPQPKGEPSPLGRARAPKSDGSDMGLAPTSDASPMETPTQTLVLPVRGLNIPFADVVLEEGDTVVVEPPREQLISVVGLVAHPGNMPYPPGVRYTLMQAIAFAGGLDLVADPRYVSVYRLAPDGEIVSVTFRLVNPHRQRQLTDALALPLKPGDVVSVEHTPRTRTNVFFDRVFRISLGLYLTPEGLWNGRK